MSSNYTAKTFIDAIPGTAGIISAIAKRVGCSWHTAKAYIDKYPTVKAVYDDELEQVIDLAETTVLKAIRDNDVGTARWFLSTKGKNRGYSERREVTGADGGAVETKTHVTGLDARLAEFMALVDAARERAGDPAAAPDNEP